ncbi:hypothetical protein DQ04_01751030 [Trypanosoma grayi]|uniref:hypothetical protein n=1 Tax=Trypanosoma grayi TaxID=71804 RepID=UPI0004F48C5D|nr:hypothetical protein DQ04_01751030 [Trypanosoma grayi]KEG12386.1 hypothetical protein DQ04_01751030 [Trypanosoma grayi]
MTSEDYKKEDSDRRGTSWISSIGGLSPSEYLSTVNTSLETVLGKLETGFHVDTFKSDVRELCIEVNRLVDYIEVCGMHCSASTYSALLATLARLHTAVAQVQRSGKSTSKPASATPRAYRIQTPCLPKDFSV